MIFRGLYDNHFVNDEPQLGLERIVLMAKKLVRMAKVEGLVSLVDQYGQLDCDVKNCQLKMEALKKPLI